MLLEELEELENKIIIEEPIEILVNLAREGEIDPWNIDIIDVTDKFLKKLEEMKKLDLRISARTLLYAAILLRMKAEALFQRNEPELISPETTGEAIDCSQDYSQGQLILLKPAIRRRAKRPVTLLELIEELKEAIDRRDKSELRRKRKLEVERTPDTEEVIAVAHDEDLEQRISYLTQLLQQKFKEQPQVEFSQLLKEKTPSGIVNTYIPLLFMAARKQIWLEQAVLYEELYIKRGELAE
ncbi:MAG: ScpA family protein [Methanocellales archaeon]